MRSQNTRHAQVRATMKPAVRAKGEEDGDVKKGL
jgi:hypothetical protein